MSTETTTAATPELPTTSAAPVMDSPLDTGSGEVVSEVDWGAVSDPDDESDGRAVAEPESFEEPAPEPTPAPVAPTVEPIPVAPVVPAAPVEAPAAPVVPAAPPVDPAVAEAQIRGELEKIYAMSEDEALAFQTEPELVLPKLAATLHMQITKDVLAGVQSIMPQLMQHVQGQAAANTQARDMFYSVNPDLDKPEVEEAIFQCGKLFRQVNPTAPAEVAAKRIGDMVRQALGMPGAYPQNEQPATAPAVAPVQSAPRIVPFSPARGGGNAPAVKPLSEWERLADEDD